MNDSAPMFSVPAYSYDADLLRWIPADAARVLEIGAVPGGLAGAFGQRRPGVEVVGVVASLPAEGEAEGYARLVQGGAESLDIARAKFKKQSFHAIVLHEPCSSAALRRLAELLAPGGAVVMSVPNLGYWRNLLELLRGRLGHGLIGPDTPLFHATREGAFALCRDAGLQIADMKPWYPAGPDGAETAEAEAFLKAAAALRELAGVQAEVLAAEARAPRFVLRATAEPVRPLLLHAMQLTPVAAVNDVRVLLPGEAVGSFPGVRPVYEVARITTGNARLAEDRVCVIQRPIHRYARPEVLKWLVRNDYLIVTEFDDHPMRWPEIEENRYLTLTAAHGVQTSTEPLAAFFRAHNPEVKVFANAVAALPPLTERPAGPVRLFFGALNREEDWKPILPELNAALAKSKDAAIDVIHDRALFDALETERKTFTPTCGHEAYLARLAAADIALMPLADTEFNRMKSDLKWLEAAACGAVALASPVVYGAAVRHGKTGMIYDSPKAFAKHLDSLIRDRRLRAKIRENAHEAVAQERMLWQQARARHDWYRSLVARRTELTEGLKARVPELFEA